MKRITIFHKEHCQPCRLTSIMLRKLGVLYDLQPLDDGSEEAEAALARAKALGITAAPIVELRNNDGAIVRTIGGYNPKALREIARTTEEEG